MNIKEETTVNASKVEEKVKEYVDKISDLILEVDDVDYQQLAPILMELDNEDMKVKVPYAYISDKERYQLAVVTMLHGLKGMDFMYNTNE